MHSHFELLP